MQEDHKKPNTLSDRALERVMRDVMSGLRDVSLQLGKDCLETATAGVSLTSHSSDEDRPANTEEPKRT